MSLLAGMPREGAATCLFKRLSRRMLLLVFIAAKLHAQQVVEWTPVQSGWLYVLDRGDPPRIFVVHPAKGTIQGILDVGTYSFDPEMALSPDGTRLYISRISSEPGLLVVDTSTGAILQQVASPTKIQFTLPSHAPTLAVSPNGKWLYMATMRSPTGSSEDDVYSIITFDTTRGVLLDRRYSTVNCGPPLLLPRKNNRELDIVCHSTNSAYHVAVGPDGALSAERRLEVPRFPLDTAWGQSVQTGAVAPNNRLVLVTGSGRIFAESTTGGALTQVDQIPNFSLSPRLMVVNQADNRIYVGIGRESGGGPPDALAILDAASLRVLSTIAVNRQFESLSISNDGRYLYAPSISTRGVLIVDTMLPHSVRELTLGTPAPVDVLVAP